MNDGLQEYIERGYIETKNDVQEYLRQQDSKAEQTLGEVFWAIKDEESLNE